ncbi:Gti1/Pac2 family-domain-containing protein [Scleroderma citrinum]
MTSLETPAATSNGTPTHPALHVRDAKDAHVVLEAVRLNMLPLIKRRLNACEREQLKSGNVFVWEEAENEGGLLRWTDGRRWSQSRMRGDYLFYEEKMETTQEEKDAKAMARARRVADPLTVVPPVNRRKDRPNRPNGLTKQTYSALVYLPGSIKPKKWHLVAYFTGDDYTRLPVIESYDYLDRLRIPQGIFVSSKANGLRNDQMLSSDWGDIYAITPPGSDLTDYSQQPSAVTESHFSTSSWHVQPQLPPPRENPSSGHRTVSLPGISSLTSLHPSPSLRVDSRASDYVQLSHPSPTNYSPLTAEDRRALDSFRVVL